MTLCPNCSNPVGTDDVFCASCGQSLSAAAAPTPREPVVVSVPDWLTSDWGHAAALAGTALLAMVAAHLVVALCYAAGIGIEQGFSRIDWGNIAEIPVTMTLAMHGGVTGLGLWGTGVVWIVAAFVMADRLGGAATFARGAVSVPDAAVRGVKAAMFYTVLIIIGFLMFEPNAISLSSASGLPSILEPLERLDDWEASAGVTLTLLIVFLIVTAQQWWSNRTDRTALFGRELPSAIPAVLSGVQRVLAIAIPISLAVVVLGAAFTEVLDQRGASEWVGDLLLTVVVSFAWSGVDLALDAIGAGLSFFSSGFEIDGQAPRWLLAVTAATAGGYLSGGYRAVREDGVKTLQGLIVVSALVAAGIAVAFVAIAILDGPEVFDGGAFGLALAWAPVAVLGGLVYGRAAGVVPAWRLQVAPNQPAAGSPAGYCQHCGVARSRGHRFCANCGGELD